MILHAQLHIDWMDYAEALIGGGATDWASPVAVSGLINKAQALMPSDGVILPVGKMLLALGQSVGLTAQSRVEVALRSLLANGHVRAQLLETVKLLRVPALALGLPAPADLLTLAATLANLPPPDMHEDRVDDAALYIADFLRAFANATLEAVILFETIDATQWRILYSPIETVVSSYRWTYSVTPTDVASWPGFRTVVIAPESKPEDVLAMVRALRQ